MSFQAKNAELHLGILQNRLINIKNKMNVAASRVSMAEDPLRKMDIAGLDIELEKLKYQALNKEYEELEKVLYDYEDSVLTLTQIKCL